MTLTTHLTGSLAEKTLHPSSQRSARGFAQSDTRSRSVLTESAWNANHSLGTRYPSYVNRSRRLLNRSPEEILSLGKAILSGEYFQVGGNQH
jgi:hypothetical protein